MNLRPLHDRVIIKRLDQESKTASGTSRNESAPPHLLMRNTSAHCRMP